MKSDNIILIGFMGAGKSTVGRALTGYLPGWTMVDSDDVISQKTGMTIPEIFANHGETYFRQVESEVIGELMKKKRQIVATGGGAVLVRANREAMLAGGMVVALKAEAGVIVSRVRHDTNRPLLQGNIEERVAKIMQERKHAYDFADLIIDTSHLTVDQVARLVLEERERLINRK